MTTVTISKQDVDTYYQMKLEMLKVADNLAHSGITLKDVLKVVALYNQHEELIDRMDEIEEVLPAHCAEYAKVDGLAEQKLEEMLEEMGQNPGDVAGPYRELVDILKVHVRVEHDYFMSLPGESMEFDVPNSFDL